MKKEDILEMSRKENKNRDLAELDVMAQAGSIAGRVGACCFLSFFSDLQKRCYAVRGSFTSAYSAQPIL